MVCLVFVSDCRMYRFATVLPLVVGVSVLLLQSTHGASIPEEVMRNGPELQGDVTAREHSLRAINPQQWKYAGANVSSSTENLPNGLIHGMQTLRAGRRRREQQQQQPVSSTAGCNRPHANIRTLLGNEHVTSHTVELVTDVLQTDLNFKEEENSMAMDFNAQQQVAICLNANLNNIVDRCFIADAVVNTALKCRDDVPFDEESILFYLSRNRDCGLHALCGRQHHHHQHHMEPAQCNCHCFSNMLASRQMAVHTVRGALRSFVDGVHSQKRATSNRHY